MFRNFTNSAKPAHFAKNERVYVVITHYANYSPLRIRATSPSQAIENGLAIMATRPTPQFRSLATDMGGNTDDGGRYNYSDCKPLETPTATRADDQRTATDN